MRGAGAASVPSPTSRESVSATLPAAACFNTITRYSIAAFAGASSSCLSTIAMTSKLGSSAVTTSAFDRLSATMRALTCTAGASGFTLIATPCVRPFESSCNACVRIRTASSAFAFVSWKVRIAVSSALEGESRRSINARTCSNCVAGALRTMLFVRTSGVAITPCTSDPRFANCSLINRATSDACAFFSTIISMRRSTPDAGRSSFASKSRMMRRSSAVPATKSAPPAAEGITVALDALPDAAVLSSRKDLSDCASSGACTNCTGKTADSRSGAASELSSEESSDATASCCFVVARTTICRDRGLAKSEERPLVDPACPSPGRCARSPSVSRASIASVSTSPCLTA